MIWLIIVGYILTFFLVALGIASLVVWVNRKRVRGDGVEPTSTIKEDVLVLLDTDSDWTFLIWFAAFFWPLIIPSVILGAALHGLWHALVWLIFDAGRTGRERS